MSVRETHVATRIALLPLLAVALVLAGCTFRLPFRRARVEAPVEAPVAAPLVTACDSAKTACPVVQTPDENTMRPRPRNPNEVQVVKPDGKGFVKGLPADAFDTSSAAQKRAALKVVDSAKERKLGNTIASLGAVGEPGFWLKTPLVSKPAKGRVVWADNGNSVSLTLLPKPGKATSGSQISLAAMRSLEIPLTALPDLIVFVK